MLARKHWSFVRNGSISSSLSRMVNTYGISHLEFSRNFAEMAKISKSKTIESDNSNTVIPEILQKTFFNDKKINLMEQIKKYPFIKTFLSQDIKDDQVKQMWPFLKEYSQQCNKNSTIGETQLRFLRQRYELFDLYTENPVSERNKFLQEMQQELQKSTTKRALSKVLSESQLNASIQILKESHTAKLLKEKELETRRGQRLWNEWVNFQNLSVGHPLIFELRQFVFEEPTSEFNDEVFSIVINYMKAYRKVNNYETPRLALNNFIKFKSRLKNNFDWIDVHHNQSGKKLSNIIESNESIYQAYGFENKKEFIQECYSHFRHCRTFQKFWDDSEKYLEAYIMNTKPLAEKFVAIQDKWTDIVYKPKKNESKIVKKNNEKREIEEKDIDKKEVKQPDTINKLETNTDSEEITEISKPPPFFVVMARLLEENLKHPNEILFPYLWKRVQEKDIDSREFAERIWNRLRLELDPQYHDRRLALMPLLDTTEREKVRLCRTRILSGERITEAFKQEMTDALASS